MTEDKMQIVNKDNTFLKDSTILISRVGDEFETYQLTDKNNEWVKSILDGITKDFDPEVKPEGFEHLNVELQLKNARDYTFGEHLIVKGKASGAYTATCVRCLLDTPQEFETEFTCAFINKRYEDDPEYEEIDEIYISDETADMFFHDRGKADLREAVAENCFLAINHYPVHDADCKGLCQTCGVDLNTDSCGHSN
ncbi:DUF177 domain-containing protein [Halobacteriovorax sp. HFRX-2_2]|uniref:YceD family protein n=1 Tax=unclassified Halobacteriovorax TaxID=2639665 RepID=UPI00371D3370